MTIFPLKEVKTRFSAIADEVAVTYDRVVVTRNGKPHVMVISVDEFESLQMTREILATPGALEDIREGARDIKEGRYHTLADARGALEARRRDEADEL
ncbi:type II toxin-antitoxin system Phd/YefM family antitoxin [Solwaraspora sp. WMMB762]|uniref:type II toxin-antitoxin system Phd/YefM family antitoxin n=1 Tax=Solwaraspora sp. WMMB762 TaxID=3404120 RepID=UPI003B94D03B